MNGDPSGFNDAPVTKTTVISTALFTIFFGLKGRSNKVVLSYKQDIFWNPTFWKAIAKMYAFASHSELMFGLFLLYYFRVFERQIGSNNYPVFFQFSVLALFGVAFIILEKIHFTQIMRCDCWFLVSYELPLHSQKKDA